MIRILVTVSELKSKTESKSIIKFWINNGIRSMPHTVCDLLYNFKIGTKKSKIVENFLKNCNDLYVPTLLHSRSEIVFESEFEYILSHQGCPGP